jgi:hypothetical protein
MIGPLSRVPNAQKATSYEEMNKCKKERTKSTFPAQNCSAPDEMTK